MERAKYQASLEYIIIIGGVIILAVSSYLILKGLEQSTAEESIGTVGTAGKKFQMEIKNMGRSETRFSAKRWGSFPQVSMLNLENTRGPDATHIRIYNLSDYGIPLDKVAFLYNDSGNLEILEHSLEGSVVNFTTPVLPHGTTEILVFHENPSALELDNLNYTSSNQYINIIDGSSPHGRSDTNPPQITISSTAYGSSGSVNDADIKVTVIDKESRVVEVYYSVEGSPWFYADNLYYKFGDIILEAHPEDYSYDHNFETIHIIATVPSEGSYTVKVGAVDEYGNEKVETQEVGILVGAPPADTEPVVISDTEPANNTLITEATLTINTTTNKQAVCRYATSPDIPYASKTPFTMTNSSFHQIIKIGLMDGVNYKYFLRCRDAHGNMNPSDFLLNFTKSGTDVIPPIIIGTEPANMTFASGSFVTINLTTNENAECRYSTDPAANYSAMTEMDVTGYTFHQLTVAVSDETFYFTCNDSNGNIGEGSYVLVLIKEKESLLSIDDVSLGAALPYQEGMLRFTASISNSTGIEGCNLSITNLNTGMETAEASMEVVSGEASATAGTFGEDRYNAAVKCSDEIQNIKSGSADFEIKRLNLFSDGSEAINITFHDADSSDDSSKIELPLGSVILNASVGLEETGLTLNNFRYESAYTTGSGPLRIHAGDFDNDGNLDVVTADHDSGTISYFSGNGDGTFQNRSSYSCGSYPRGIFSGDFDNDSNLDVIVGRYWDNKFAYIKGNGDGTFQSPVNYATGGSTNRLYAGDFDKDGNLDVVTANHAPYPSSSSFSYFRGKGDGTFQGRVDYPIGASNYGGGYGIYAGDFDNDGNLDVVITHSGSGRFSYFRGNGDGTFQGRVDYGTGTGAGDIDAGDFDKDGNLDVVLQRTDLYSYSNRFMYYKGNGDGTFQNTGNYEAGKGGGGIHAGDFNNDSNLDVITGNPYSNRFMYFEGKGDGTFQAAVEYGAGTNPSDIYAADFDNDGGLDVVATNDNLNEFSYISGNFIGASHCTNPKLDIGSDGSTEWSYTGELNASDLFYGENFVTELNSLLPACTCPGCEKSGAKCTLTFNFSTETPGKLRLFDLAVQHAMPE